MCFRWWFFMGKKLLLFSSIRSKFKSMMFLPELGKVEVRTASWTFGAYVVMNLERCFWPHIPSLKLAVRPWKWMVERRFFPFGWPIFRGHASFGEGKWGMNRMGSLWAVFSTLLVGDLTLFITVRGPPCIEWCLFLESQFNRWPCESLKLDKFSGVSFVCAPPPQTSRATETENLWLDPPKIYQSKTPNLMLGGMYLPGCLGVEVIVSSRARRGRLVSLQPPRCFRRWGIGCAVNFGWLRWPDRTGWHGSEEGRKFRRIQIRKDVSLRIRWYVLRIRD